MNNPYQAPNANLGQPDAASPLLLKLHRNRRGILLRLVAAIAIIAVISGTKHLTDGDLITYFTGTLGLMCTVVVLFQLYRLIVRHPLVSIFTDHTTTPRRYNVSPDRLFIRDKMLCGVNARGMPVQYCKQHTADPSDWQELEQLLSEQTPSPHIGFVDQPILITARVSVAAKILPLLALPLIIAIAVFATSNSIVQFILIGWSAIIIARALIALSKKTTVLHVTQDYLLSDTQVIKASAKHLQFVGNALVAKIDGEPVYITNRHTVKPADWQALQAYARSA